MPVQIDRHLINRMPWLIELRGTHPELVIRYGGDAILIVPRCNALPIPYRVSYLR